MNEFFLENGKFTYISRKRTINNLIREYNFLNYGIIGKSLCGRDLDFLSLGNTKNMNIWVSAHHGMEWLTSMLVFKFLKSACEKIKKNEKICGISLKKCYDEKGLLIIPCINPDGVDISLLGPKAAGKYFKFVEKISKGKTFDWQANARGVDLNHNYDAGWHELSKLEKENFIIGPSKTRFGGIRPISEPETIALTSFCLKNNFSSAIAFHSQGEEIYWNYGNETPKKSEKMARMFALSSGYEISNPENLAVGGGFKDWFISKFKKPALTVEIGKGKNPLPKEQLEKIYNKVEKSLYMSSIL